MKVKELMSAEEIKVCTPETKISTVARVMQENNRGALPVVDQEHKVVGIITDRDICLALAAKHGKTPDTLEVKEVARAGKVFTVTTEQPITAALAEMRQHKIGRLPVTDKEGRLKGVLSINNILTHALEHPKFLGTLVAHDENPARTVKALFERNQVRPVRPE